MFRKAWWFFKCSFGFGSVKDTSICWFSSNYYDVHDYHKDSGGDGFPAHFYEYECTKCGKKFTI